MGRTKRAGPVEAIVVLVAALAVVGCSSGAGEPASATPHSDAPPTGERIADGDQDLTDATLGRLRDALPAGWSMTLTSTELRLERDEPAWVLFENQINAPMGMETDAQRALRIEAHGERVTPHLTYRVEPRWSAARIADASAANARVADELTALAETVDHLRDERFEKDRHNYSPKNPAEQEQLRIYETDRAQLEATLIELPVCNTETLSMFRGAELGFADDMHLVHPKQASQEVYTVRQRVRAICEGVSPGSTR